MTEQKQGYKTVRIYKDDAEALKSLSYRTGKKIVHLIGDTTDILQTAQKIAFRTGRTLDSVLADMYEYVKEKNKETIMERRVKENIIDEKFLKQ